MRKFKSYKEKKENEDKEAKQMLKTKRPINSKVFALQWLIGEWK